MQHDVGGDQIDAIWIKTRPVRRAVEQAPPQAPLVRHALRLFEHAQRRIAAPDLCLRELGGDLQRVVTATRADLEDSLVIAPRQYGENLPALRENIARVVARDVLAMNQLAMNETLVLMTIPAAGGPMYPRGVGVRWTPLARNRFDGRRTLHQGFEPRFEFAAYLIERGCSHSTVIDAAVFGECRKRRGGRRFGERRIDLAQALVEIVGHRGLIESCSLNVGIDARLEP